MSEEAKNTTKNDDEDVQIIDFGADAKKDKKKKDKDDKKDKKEKKEKKDKKDKKEEEPIE
jgi:hypothetical protein